MKEVNNQTKVKRDGPAKPKLTSLISQFNREMNYQEVQEKRKLPHETATADRNLSWPIYLLSTIPAFLHFTIWRLKLGGNFVLIKKNPTLLKKTRYISPIIRYAKYSELTQTSLTSEKTHCLLLCAQQLPQTPPKAQFEACKKPLCGLNNALKATDAS